MPKTVLITRPDYDDATYYLSAWTKSIVVEADLRGHTVYKIDSKKCTKNEFEERIQKNKPVLVLFNGHGAYDKIIGHNSEVLVQKNVNDHLLKNKIIHAFACSSANQLGPSAIQKGALAFVGFEQDFVFLQDERHSAAPLKDSLAKHFLESVNVVPIALLKGNSVGNAFEKSQTAFDKAIQFFETQYTMENSHILFWLRYDKTIHSCLGNKNITINDIE